MNLKIALVSSLAASVSLIAGCVSAPRGVQRPATIGHIVFVELNDEGDFEEILADSDEMLATIPSVSTFAAGGHLDTGRSSVLNDYDLAIYLGFDSEEDLAAYVSHVQHIAYVEKWIPRIKGLRVHDMFDPTP